MAVGTINGLTGSSMINMQVNSGAFFTELVIPASPTPETVAAAVTASLEAGNCLGATTGGGVFNAVPETRQIEADGMRYAIIGSTIFDTWNITLTGTLKEITEENWLRVLPTSVKDSTSGAIRARTSLLPSDYIKELSWVGNLNDGGVIVIQIDNALNIAGAAFTFVDKGEGTIPFEFRGHVSDLATMDYAPFRIHIIKPAGTRVGGDEG